jgi:hypothetical protein
MTVQLAYKQAPLRKSDKEKQIDRWNRLAKANPRDDREPESTPVGARVSERRERGRKKEGRKILDKL